MRSRLQTVLGHCLIVLMVLFLFPTTAVNADNHELPEDDLTPHTHSLSFTAAKAATCTETGNIGYYYCSGCGKYFSDAAGANEITLAQTVIQPMDANNDGGITASDAAAYLAKGSRFDAAAVLQKIVGIS